MLHTFGTQGSENGSYTLMVPTHGHRRSQHARPWSRRRGPTLDCHGWQGASEWQRHEGWLKITACTE